MQRDSFLNHFKNFLLLLVVFFSEKVRGASVLDSFGAFAFAFSICLFVCGSFFFFFFFFFFVSGFHVFVCFLALFASRWKTCRQACLPRLTDRFSLKRKKKKENFSKKCLNYVRK
jgi:hypothetical protein